MTLPRLTSYFIVIFPDRQLSGMSVAIALVPYSFRLVEDR
jgi:hypothetical protein